MSEPQGQPGNQPGPESSENHNREDECLEQTAQAGLHRDLSPLYQEHDPNFPPRDASTNSVLTIQPPTTQDNMSSSANNTPQGTDVPEQRPAAALDFSNEPFANDQERDEWLAAFMGDRDVVGETQPVAVGVPPADVEMNDVGTSTQVPTTATQPRPEGLRPEPLAQEVPAQHLANPANTASFGADAAKMDNNNPFATIISAMQQNGPVRLTPTSQPDINHGEVQPQEPRGPRTSSAVQSSSRNYGPSSHLTGVRSGKAPAGNNAGVRRNGALTPQISSPSKTPFQGKVAEAFCRRTCSFIGFSYQFSGTSPRMVGQVYVEKLEPLRRNSSVPLILVHGDFHTSQVWLTKPDGDPGWASFFVNKGYEVHVLDVPPSGRSCWFDQETLANSPRAHVSVKDVEDYLTAPATQSADCWPTAASHSQWPGSGKRGDPVFDQYYASLNPLHLGRPERQVMARDAVVQLLTEIGPAVLVGEGSGANAAWLAADLDPSRAVGVIAVEPAGPPFGNAFQRREDGKRVYTPSVRYRPGTRAFGISDIPLEFDPPANPDMSLSLDPEDVNAERPLDLVNVDAIDGNHSLVLQASAKDEGVTRQLINLKKVKHFVFTAHASFHSVFDATTCLFMEQAGVEVRHITLGAAGILGNGHLMFLKKNSDRLADMVHSCIKLGFQGPQPSRGSPAISTPRLNGRGQAVALGNSAKKARPTTVVSGNAKTASRVSPQKPNSGTRKTAVSSERAGAKRGLPPDSPQELTPSQTSKKKKKGGAPTGPELSQMQQHLQSDHFQRLQQPRPVPSGQDPSRIAQPFTASLTRNPAMPAPANLQAFGEQIPGTISLHLPERRHSAYMDRQGQGEQEHARAPGTSPRSAPSFQIHGLAQPQAGFVRSPLQVQNAMSHGARSNEAGPVSATGPPSTTPLHAMSSPRNVGQGIYNSSQFALDAKTPTSQQGEHRPTGDTTIAMEGAVWQPQSPSTPTRGPRAAAGTASAKKPNTKPKKSVSEAEEDEDYDPATESAKPARSRARSSKAGAAAKKGNKGKNAEADQVASVAPEGEAPKTKAAGGGKAGQGTAAKNTKKSTKSKNAIAEDHEGAEIGSLPQPLAENEPKPSKSIVIKRKRKQTDIEGDGEEDSTNNETAAGGETKRARSSAPSPREEEEAEAEPEAEA